jgi:hypothetical protein
MKGQALIDAIVAKSSGLTKCRRQFLSHILMLFLSVRHRINFLQLARHSDQYCEHSMRLHFEQYLDFATINQPLIQQYGSGHYLLALDASYLPKSGKATPGLGKYWSGSAQKALWGLEVSLLSVIDVVHRTAWHLDATQTPDKTERLAKDISLLDHYAQTVVWQVTHCKLLSAYLAVDAYFAKASFIDRITTRTDLHIISLLRQDARLRYHYKGPKTKAKGRPRQFSGPVDFTQPDFDYFALSYQDAELRIYSGVVNCPFLKRDIKVAYTQYLDATGLPTHYKLYFSTDLNLSAWMIVKYYRLRYQQEFLIRDAKQFTGLTDCQARSLDKFDYHLNTALSAVNVAKVEQGVGHQPFSMADVKTLYHNRLLLDRFFSILPEGTKLTKNDPKVRQLYSFGCMAA